MLGGPFLAPILIARTYMYSPFAAADMKPGKMYWEFVILARKLGIVAVAVGLSNTTSYQLAMMLLVLFIAFVLQVKHNPYLSHTDRPKVVAEHEAKVALLDPLHRAIEADMVALAKQNTRANRRVRGFVDVKVLSGRSKADYNLLVALDYNTVRDFRFPSGAPPFSSLVCLHRRLKRRCSAPPSSSASRV